MEIERLPCAQVSPAEGGLEHPGAAGFLHHSIVNRDGRAVLVDFGYEGLLLGSAVVLVSVLEEGIDLWQPSFQCLADGGGIPYEYSGVPEKLSAVDEYLRQFAVRLLGESLHLVGNVAVHGGGFLHAALDVAVAGLRTGRIDAQSKQLVLVRRVVHGGCNGVYEEAFIGNEMIRGGHNHRCIRIHVPYPGGRVCDAGCGVAAVGLGQDVLQGKVRQMLVHQVRVGCGCDYENILPGYNLDETVVCQLYEAFAYTQDVQELFGPGVPAYRPETAADASCHDHAVEIIVHHLVESL